VWVEEASRYIKNQKLTITRDGRLGLVPAEFQHGDAIAIFRGCNLPIILRPYQNGYKWIGPCYIDGLMFGEALEGNVCWETVTIF